MNWKALDSRSVLISLVVLIWCLFVLCLFCGVGRREEEGGRYDWWMVDGF